MLRLKPSSNLRIASVAFLLILLFSVLIIQFYRIQIVEGEEWARKASRQHYFIIDEPFIRGTFYSNTALKKGCPEIPQKLVLDIEKYHLYIDPESIPEKYKEDIAEQLVKKLFISNQDKSKFQAHFFQKSRSRKLKMWLDKEEQQQILDWWKPYARAKRIPRNALFFVQDFQRSYPFGKLLGQVLHTVQSNKDETTGQAIPTGGLELYFNRYLMGKPGKRRLMRSPSNSLEIGELLVAPQNGADVYLTINHCLQAIAEEELERGVKACKAKSGWAIMMDPYTGAILALAQYPFFSPSESQVFFNDPQQIKNTTLKAVIEANEPGSVMKPVTIALALNANEELKRKGQKPIFDPEAKMATSNSSFPGRKNLKDTHLHYFLNMDMAIQRSSNIYVARLADQITARLGAEWYKKSLHEIFGFGEKTGLEVPSESAGLVPTPGKKHPNGTLEWSVPTPYSLAMGHNIQITTLQLARAYAVLANGGYLVQPTIVRKIVRKNNAGQETMILDQSLGSPFQRGKKVLDEKVVKKIVNALRFTTKPGGTARKGDIHGYTEAGKSGTAQKIINGKYSDFEYCSSFAGFTPVGDCSFVLVVTMDEPEYGYIPGVGKNHHGGTCAAPVFREIAKRSLEYLGIAPDDPYGYPAGDPRCDPARAIWMPETHKLQEMYEKWNIPANSISKSKTTLHEAKKTN
jgi:cell division protein FtsI (penicillin-binding protein 3)